jgi:hypothetical protein
MLIVLLLMLIVFLLLMLIVLLLLMLKVLLLLMLIVLWLLFVTVVQMDLVLTCTRFSLTSLLISKHRCLWNIIVTA